MKPLHRLLVTLAVLCGLLTSCHTLDKYRPVPPRTPAELAADPRPDLVGKPVLPGHPLYNMEQAFRRLFPDAHPWTLRSVPLQGDLLGVTHYDAPLWLAGERSPTGALVVEVRDDLDGWLQRDVLLHEFAHVLAWDAPESAHGPVWAAYFGVLYKITRGED